MHYIMASVYASSQRMTNLPAEIEIMRRSSKHGIQVKLLAQALEPLRDGFSLRCIEVLVRSFSVILSAIQEG